MPPHFGRAIAAETVAIQPSVSSESQETHDAERTEAGPGPKQVASRIGPRTQQAHVSTSRVGARAFCIFMR
jgi:hypothetical protein